MSRSSAAASAAREPLGSLTQPGARVGVVCSVCESPRVTRISMELEDGTQVDFTNCLDCEHRTWQAGDDVLSVEHVLARAQRTR